MIALEANPQAPHTVPFPPCRERIRASGRFFHRQGSKYRVCGMTYGPFAPNDRGEPFRPASIVRDDLERMQSIGVNSLRTYYVPPDWFLDILDEQGITALIDIPWSKHLCFLDSEDAQRQARRAVREAAERGSSHPSVLAYSIGNEIPASIVRWHGAQRVERFLAELMDVAKQADPEGLVTYANYPSTEYLDLSFLDFSTFNVYLHDPEEFRRYLLRLQNLAGERPLLLGEIGMDTLRHGEEEQAVFLEGHLREATLQGLAGAYVFSWTDDWFTGGYQIEDWAFGITDADRGAKQACFGVRRVYTASPAALLSEAPRVSVVVCSYNGAPTLDQCLRSLLELDYPDYEVLLVDDGSTDGTREIAARYPHVKYIYQPNRGLSVARNVGWANSTGSMVAYTDSDCFADPDWLTHLVYQLQKTGAAGVGGPNVTPDDGPLAACVSASPGQPTHVLENDQTAEHIPGCNMAFTRQALEAIGGFNAQYCKAGDDVDLCWRLQQAGFWITFAPGATVWHHRRQDARRYLRQQAGYGEAEGLLWFEHPARFNLRGEGRWRGTLYGGTASGIRFGRPIVFRGAFGAGLFQTLYQPGQSHWALLPSSMEWHIAAAIPLMLGTFWRPLWWICAAMLALSAAVAAIRAWQAPLPRKYRCLRSRALVLGLSYVQPLVRSWWRYRTRLFPPNIPPIKEEVIFDGPEPFPVSGRLCLQYWDEKWRDRTELLHAVVDYLTNHRWAVKVDTGWSDWDLEIFCHPWTVLQVCSAQEDHGSGRRLIRLRYRLRPTHYTLVLFSAMMAVVTLAVALRSPYAAATAAMALTACLGLWARGINLAGKATGLVATLARGMEMSAVDPTPTGRRSALRRETIQSS